MIAIGANGNKTAYGIKHYNLDTLEDLLALNPAKLTMGTTAFIIDSSKYYMVNGSGMWKQINPQTSGGSGSAPDINDEVIYEGGGVESDNVDDEVIYEGGGVGGDSTDEDIYEGGGV